MRAQQLGGRRPQECPGGDREDTIERGERHERHDPGRPGDQREPAEHDRLGEMQRREDPRALEPLEPNGEDRCEQSRDEAGGQEQRRGSERAVRPIEHEHRERDLAQPVAELVDRVAGRHVAEAGDAQRSLRSDVPRAQARASPGWRRLLVARWTRRLVQSPIPD